MSGSWRLDTAASRVDPAAGLAGLIGAGAPPMLYVTQPANGTLIVESPINESHVRIYRPGVSTRTPVGQGGTITMTSAWGPRTLTSEGTSVTAAGASANVKETYSLSADGTDVDDRGEDGRTRRDEQHAEVRAHHRCRPVRIVADAVQTVLTGR